MKKTQGETVCVQRQNQLRIEDGGLTVLHVPVEAVVAVDRVLRHCLGHDLALAVTQIERAAGWVALTSGGESHNRLADTPWMALVALARRLERKGHR